MPWNQILPTEVDANSPLDETLFSSKIKNNDDDHEARLLSLEAQSGSSSAEDTTRLFAQFETDPQFVSNEGHMYSRRFNVQSNFNDSTEDVDGLIEKSDFENEDRRLMTFFSQGNQKLINSFTLADHYYQGATNSLPKDADMNFLIKKGWNWFGIGVGRLFTDMCDNIEILIDGQPPSSFGLTDGQGEPAPDFISANTAQLQYQRCFLYFGLDGNEHLITVINRDSATKAFYFNYVDVGYLSRDYTIDRKIKFNNFRAAIQGIPTNINGTELEFSKPIGNGYAAAVLADTSGNLRKIEGTEGAFTSLRSGQTVEFSNPVTSLKVVNAYGFPDRGICIMSYPLGGNFIFSYSGKTTTNIQGHTLDGIKWVVQPSVDLDIDVGFAGNALGTARGNCVINLWAMPTIQIDTSNNKIDFQITILDLNGIEVTTTHTATIDSGWYSADLVSLSKFIELAMEQAKPIKSIGGRYYVSWSKITNRWQIGADGKNIVSLSLLFANGANVASSVHPTMGFSNTDLIGSKVYPAVEEKKHMAPRVYVKDNTIYNPVQSRAKFGARSTATSTAFYEDPAYRGGMFYTNFNFQSKVTWKCYPDPDATGLSVVITPHTDSNGIMLEVQIDDGEQFFIYSTRRDTGPTGTRLYASLDTIFISFPRGSRSIKISSQEYNVWGQSGFTIGSSTGFKVEGFRQWFSRPPLEEININESIVKVFNIAPVVPRFKTIFGNNLGALYVPDVSDPLGTITESGSGWAATALGQFFNGYGRVTSAIGDFVEIIFTIPSGERGGIGVMFHRSTDGCENVEFYMSQTTINETTDLIKRVQLNSALANYSDGDETFRFLNIPSGTYRLRIKNARTTASLHQMRITGWVVYTEKPIQENKYVIPNMAVNGQSLCVPFQVKKETILQNSADRVLNNLKASNYNFGITNGVRYSVDTSSARNYGTGDNLSHIKRNYYGNEFQVGQNRFVEWFGLCKSITNYAACTNGTVSTNCVGFIDGRQIATSFNSRVQARGGNANNTNTTYTPMVTKNFEMPVTSMTGKIITMGDTRGFKIGQPILLIDSNGDTEKKYIAAVTTDVSVEIDTPLENLLPANIVRVHFYGFHSMRVRNDDTGIYWPVDFSIEPLDITPSRFKKLISTDKRLEKVVYSYEWGSASPIVPLPVFSDGSEPTSSEMSYGLTLSGVTNTGSMVEFPRVTSGGQTYFGRCFAIKEIYTDAARFEGFY